MGNKPVKFNIVLNVANNKWSIWNITGSKIYFVMQITKEFYVGMPFKYSVLSVWAKDYFLNLVGHT